MNKFDHILENGYEFEMNKYFNEGWDLFKKGAGSFIGFTILIPAILVVAIIIPIVNLFASLLFIVLPAGYFIFCRGLSRKNEDFSMFFRGFNYFGQIFLFALVLFLFYIPGILLMFGVIIPPDLIADLFTQNINSQDFVAEISYGMEERMGLFFGSYFLIIILTLYLSTSYSFTLPLIVDEGMNFWKAMETSRKVVAKKFFPFVGLYILLGLMLAFGSGMTCYLGMLALLPLYYCVTFAAYDNILQPKKDMVAAQLDEFGRQEKDTNTESEDNT